MLSDNKFLSLNFFHLAAFIADILFSRMDKHHQVSVLFDRARISKIGELGFATASFDRARELRECYNRNIELAGKMFERARDLGNLLNHRVIDTRGRWRHELKIIDYQKLESFFNFKFAGRRAHFHDSIARLVVNIDGGTRELIERIANIFENIISPSARLSAYPFSDDR